MKNKRFLLTLEDFISIRCVALNRNLRNLRLICLELITPNDKVFSFKASFKCFLKNHRPLQKLAERIRRKTRSMCISAGENSEV